MCAIKPEVLYHTQNSKVNDNV